MQGLKGDRAEWISLVVTAEHTFREIQNLEPISQFFTQV